VERSAEIGNLLDLEKHFPEVKIIKLEQNYRSTNTILHAANAIIKNNPRRRAKQLWSSKDQGNKTARRLINPILALQSQFMRYFSAGFPVIV
jgi:DNA helicase II / ATP-dependent DNA helicase PcrA